MLQMKKKSEITNKSGILSQIQKYGIKKLIFSWDFIGAVVFFTVLILSKKLGWHLFTSANSDSFTFIITVATAIFSVLITALAIILSFSSSNFVKFLRDHDIFDKITFIFWWASLAFLTVILLSFIKYIISFTLPAWSQGVGTALILSTFYYALIETFYVVGALMRFAFFLGHYESRIANKK
jgi:hypothetical protein